MDYRARALLLAAVIVIASYGHAQDYETYRKKYEEALLVIVEEHSQQVANLMTTYSTGLNTVKAAVQAAGDLDKLKSVMGEIDRLRTAQTLPKENDKPIPEVLALAKDCQANTGKAHAARAQRILTLTSQYDRALLSLQKEHTRKGELDKATAIQEERKTLAETETVAAARAVLAQKGPVEEPRPVSRVVPKPVFLSDLKESDVHVGYGSFGKGGKLGYEGGKIVVDGKASDKGLSMHPPAHGSSRVSYAIAGKYKWFLANIGLNDTVRKSNTPLTFKVVGDGKELWSSKPLQHRGDHEDVKVDIRRVKQLRLEVNCPGAAGFAHAVWIDPRLQESD